ncbi:hypothetical protein EVAR_82880_1 [Eumeta japonica]|uniref:Uncharacterized protein n=1 Tax=Eumeta variegata TaxID=151549 RepID=A0A4C1V3A7_EUMVA|nr:hypothetical protein EVAR_82880_1 [Eumeta japonica]
MIRVLICDALLKRNETEPFLKSDNDKWNNYDKNERRRYWLKGKQAPQTIEKPCLTKLLFSSRLEGGGGYRHPQARETTRPPCQLQTDQPPERSGQTFRENSQNSP